MDITKLAPNIDQIRTKFKTKLNNATVGPNPVEGLLDQMLSAVADYKKWTDSVAKYSKDSSLQNLPLEYYQICAKQAQAAYEQTVLLGVPKLLELGLVDKDGKPLP